NTGCEEEDLPPRSRSFSLGCDLPPRSVPLIPGTLHPNEAVAPRQKVLVAHVTLRQLQRDVQPVRIRVRAVVPPRYMELDRIRRPRSRIAVTADPVDPSIVVGPGIQI